MLGNGRVLTVFIFIYDDVSWFIIFNVYKIFYHELVYIIGLNILEIWRFFCISNILPIAPSFAATAEHQCAIDVGISSGRTPLFTASSYGQISLVQMLLDARAQVDAKNDDGPRAQIAVIASPSMRQKLHKVETGCSVRQSFNPNRISNSESSCFPFETDQ